MDQAKAETVLRRFSSAIKLTARIVAETFPSVAEIEDAEQEASILILSYAGLVPGGRHSGALLAAERDAEFDEERVKNIITTKLRLDLSQQYGREAEKRVPTISLDLLTDAPLPPVFDLADSLSHENGFRRDYPTLALWLMDDMTEEQIADFAEVSDRTVRRRIAKEKVAYLTRYARRGGLKVTGEESLTELQEACSHLRAAGR